MTDLPKVYCVVCDTSQPATQLEECMNCGNKFLLSEHSLDRPDTWPQELKDAVVKKDKAERERTAKEELAAKNAEHPIDKETSELDMSSELNNPLIPTAENEVQYEPGDMMDPENNPLLPDSTAAKDFGNEKEVDYSRAEHNPLIPK